MSIKKKKISELPEVSSFAGLSTIGVDEQNRSVRVGLEFVKEAAENAQDVADHPTYVGEDNYVYRYDMAAGQYVKTTVYVKGDTGEVDYSRLEPYALKTSVPSATSQLTNDSRYINETGDASDTTVTFVPETGEPVSGGTQRSIIGRLVKKLADIVSGAVKVGKAADADTVGGKSTTWIMSHELGNLVPHAVLGHSYGFGNANNGWPTTGSYICFGSNNQYGPLVQIQTNHQNSAEMWTRSQENVTGKWSPWKRIAMAEELADIVSGALKVGNAANADTVGGVSSERIVQKSGGDMDDGATLYFQNNVGRWGATGTYFKNPYTGEVLGGIGGIGLDGDLRALYMGFGPSPYTDDKCFKVDGVAAYLYGKQVATTDPATTVSNGLMSAQDKQKLDGIAGVNLKEEGGALWWKPTGGATWFKIADTNNTHFD